MQQRPEEEEEEEEEEESGGVGQMSRTVGDASFLDGQAHRPSCPAPLPSSLPFPFFPPPPAQRRNDMLLSIRSSTTYYYVLHRACLFLNVHSNSNRRFPLVP